MTSHPIEFMFQDIIAGRGYLVIVRTNGQAILRQEDSRVWIASVYPVGIDGGGRTRADALQSFRDRYRSMLFLVAAEADSFISFAGALDFWLRSDPQSAAEWTQALTGTGYGFALGGIMGQSAAEWTQALTGVGDLPAGVPSEPSLEVREVHAEMATPDMNALDAFVEITSAAAEMAPS